MGMTTLLNESINDIRQYIRRNQNTPNRWDKQIKMTWETILFYRSDKLEDVYLVKGLFEQDVYYRTEREANEAIEDFDLDEEYIVTIETEQMTGCSFGRLEFMDDF